MSMQKLSAGSGYTYLTKQVARQDVAERGHVTLASYYSERGEVPGVWMGSGMASIEGLAAGDMVTAEQMRALFGAGVHPLVELPAPRFEGEQPTAEELRGARRLGNPFRGAAVTEFRREVADRFTSAAQGKELSRAEAAALLGEIRTALATEQFTAAHGRAPSAVELASVLARANRSPAGVAGFDLTFSPVKSVSALWALADPATAAAVERAHQAAMRDTLGMIEQHALFTRVGTDGVYQVETTGLVAAAFTHRDSRAGDPDLHTHVVVANKVQTRDGRWLSIDARVLYKAKVAASETYNTSLEAHLRDALGVRFAPREERLVREGKRPVRELVGVDLTLLKAWSHRRVAIEHRVDELAGDFQLRHGRVPTSAEQLALAQQANLETREAKHEPRTLAEQRAHWEMEARDVLGPNGIQRMLHRVLDQHPEPSRTFDEAWQFSAAQEVVARMENDRAVWGPWHVRAEAQRVAREHDVPLAQLPEVVEGVVDLSLNEVSIQLRAADHGAGTALYSSAAILAAEQSLIERAECLDAPVLSEAEVEAAIGRSPVELNEGQAALVRELATSGRRVQAALAPAGTGKTTAVATLADAWISAGGNVLGLAPSAAAAQQLGEHLLGPCDTLAKHQWTLNHPDRSKPAWWDQIDQRTLVIIDEAAMASTPLLSDVVGNLASRGATVRMLGDDRQLAAIGAGGIVRDLARVSDAPELTDAVRFRDPAEAEAVAKLREGDATGLRYHFEHGRIHAAAGTEVYRQIVSVWAADRAAGKDSIMLASSREEVTKLNREAQHQLYGSASRGHLLELSDGTHAGVGDHIITRRNDRRLPTSATDWVKNGDRWTVRSLGDDGALNVVNKRTGQRAHLPGAYVAEHVQLGYATTIHAAQGLTADTSYTLLRSSESRQQLYTAATRGRVGNHFYVEAERGTCDSGHGPDPRQIVAAVLARDDRKHSAHAVRAIYSSLVDQPTDHPERTKSSKDYEQRAHRRVCVDIPSSRRTAREL